MQDTSVAKVLIADPSLDAARSIKHAFEKIGWVAYCCTTGKQMRLLLEEVHPTLLVSELRLSDGPCLQLLKQIREEHIYISIVVLTGHGSVASAVECYRTGITAYLKRGSAVEDILACLYKAGSERELVKSMPSSIDRLCWEYINRVVAHAGSISKAADLLDIDRRSLRRMLSKYEPPE